MKDHNTLAHKEYDIFVLHSNIFDWFKTFFCISSVFCQAGFKIVMVRVSRIWKKNPSTTRYWHLWDTTDTRHTLWHQTHTALALQIELHLCTEAIKETAAVSNPVFYIYVWPFH